MGSVGLQLATQTLWPDPRSGSCTPPGSRGSLSCPAAPGGVWCRPVFGRWSSRRSTRRVARCCRTPPARHALRSESLLSLKGRQMLRELARPCGILRPCSQNKGGKQSVLGTEVWCAEIRGIRAAAMATYRNLGVRGCITTADVKHALTGARAAATQLHAMSALVGSLEPPYNRIYLRCIEKCSVTDTVRWIAVSS